MLKYLKLPLEQIVKQMMQKLLMYSIFPLETLCLTSVTIIWEITQILFLQNCSWFFEKGTEKFRMMNKLHVVEKHEQEKNKRMEIYYDRLLKLANNLQHKTINSFFIIIFKSGLQPYMCVPTIGLKK
jgi:hypothetical protein